MIPTKGASRSVAPLFPFTAIVGQACLKMALELLAVEARIGGLLVIGEKGTAKSTAVRACADLLPPRFVLQGCPLGLTPEERDRGCAVCGLRCTRTAVVLRSTPVVELPLNATEDRVAGSIDMSAALREGRSLLEPGLLARAHGGLLYVDEVNLLDDHLVDLLLDAAASGLNLVEREGISAVHPARFVLVGTMNPEEGELRPHLRDRFGMCVRVMGERDAEARVRLMELRERFDEDPAAFRRDQEEAESEVRRKIERARLFLPALRMPARVRLLVASMSLQSGVAGHRADIALERAARAHAALRQADEVTAEDVAVVQEMVLLHRRRDLPPPPPPASPREQGPAPRPREAGSREPSPPAAGGGEAGDAPPRPEGEGRERVFEVGAPFRVRPLTARRDRVVRRGSGRRSRTRTSQKQGRYVRARAGRDSGDVALDATIRAAAPHQRHRRPLGRVMVIEEEDIRHKVRERRIGIFLHIVVDASGSMGAQARMVAAKGAVLSLLLDAYQKRDRISMTVVRGSEARLLVPPTSSVELAARLLRDLPTGGRTPLASGLGVAHRAVRGRLARDPTSRPIVMLITDGRANVSMAGGDAQAEVLGMAAEMAKEDRVRFIVVDTEGTAGVRFGLARVLAGALGAEYHAVDDLRAGRLVDIVRRSRGGEQ